MHPETPIHPLRVVFLGTAEIACASLQALVEAENLILLSVVSQPDRPRGRQLQLQPTPVKQRALELGVPCLQPDRCRDERFLGQLRILNPDVIAVMAYGQILPKALLEIPRLGCLNVHTSLLPRYRGAAPIQWAIWNGDAETGVTIMRMDEGLDTGDILLARATPIADADDAQTVHDRLAGLGAELLVQGIRGVADGSLRPVPQPAEGVTYARKITKEDGKLDWIRSARELWNQVRALTPWPGTFTHLPGGARPVLLKVWRAEPVAAPAVPPGQVMKADREGIVVTCGEGALRLLEVQKEGGKRLAARDFLGGNPLSPGTRLIG